MAMNTSSKGRAFIRAHEGNPLTCYLDPIGVPTIGPGTVETLAKAGGRVLAVESEKTIVIDQQQVVDLADRHNITIVATHRQQIEDRLDAA